MTPKWNFSKYLVDHTGQVVGGYASKIAPDDKALNEKIAAQLEAAAKAAEPAKATPATPPSKASAPAPKSDKK